MKQKELAGQLELYTAQQTQRAELDVLLQEVIAEARALSIPVSEHILPHVKINKRAVGRFGACFANRKTGTFQIEISDVLLEAPAACRQTLAHEVLHTCYGCQNHKKRWHRYADMMNSAYGYEISRTNTAEKLGVQSKRVAKYIVACSDCGAEIPRTRKSRVVSHPEEYRCAKCGGHLHVKQSEDEA